MEQTFAELLIAEKDFAAAAAACGSGIGLLSQNAVSSPAISDMTRMREYCLKELEKEFKI